MKKIFLLLFALWASMLSFAQNWKSQYSRVSEIEDYKEQKLFSVEKDGFRGLCDAKGNLIIPCKYRFVFPPEKKDGEIYIIVVNKEELYGLCDGNGKEIISCKYGFVNTPEKKNGETYITVQNKEGLDGLCDGNGKEIIPCKYGYVSIPEKKDGKTYIQVKNKEGLYGLCDGNGREIISCKYGRFVDIPEKKNGETYIRVQNKEGLYGLCDGNGKEILPCQFGGFVDIPEKKNGETYIRFQNKEGLYGLCDGNGKEILPCQFGFVLPEKFTITIVNSDKKYGIADYNGHVILDCIADAPITFGINKEFDTYLVGGKKTNNGFVGGKYGIISRHPLKVLTPAKYDDYGYMLNCMAVSIGSKWGVVNANGDEIVKLQYADVRLATNDLFSVNTGGTIDKNNQTIGGKWGLVDSKGNTLIPCQYDEPIIFKQDVAMVKKDGEVKLIKNPLVDKSAVTIADGTVASYKKKASGPAVSRYPAPNSDVDKDIPQTNVKSENTFAFVVANENYPDAPVPYALNDGRMFAQYCEKALGIPQKNINLYEDATYGNIVTMIDKIKNVASAFEGEASILLYYAGHGFPDEKQGSAYLLPIDGSGSEISTTGYSLKHLYDELSRLPLKRAVVLLDACFSGAKREDDMLAQSRGVAIKVKEEQPKGHLLVFSASQGDETAHQMAEKHHGLFTYYLLKGMQQLRGNANWGDLTDFVTKNVKRQSVVINNKKQTPTVIPSSEIFNTWRTIRLQ